MTLLSSIRVFAATAIAFSFVPLNVELSQANPTGSIQANAGTSLNLTGQWVLGSIEADSKLWQQPGKLGMSVTQNGNQLRVQPVIGVPMMGQISGQQVQVTVPDGKNILGNVSQDGNRVLLTLSGAGGGTGVLVRVGSPGCPNRGSWNSTIQSCNLGR